MCLTRDWWWSGSWFSTAQLSLIEAVQSLFSQFTEIRFGRRSNRISVYRISTASFRLFDRWRDAPRSIWETGAAFCLLIWLNSLKQQSGVDTAALKYTGWHILGHRDDFRKTCWVQASWKTVVLLHKLPALYWYKAAKLPVQQQHLKLISLEFKIDTTWALHMWTERPAPSYKPTSLTQRTRWLLYWRWTWALDINCEMQNPPIWM